MKKKEAAILLSGAISKKRGAYLFGTEWNDKVIQETKSNYVKFNSTYLSIKHNIIDANPDFHFDIFIVSWNPDLETELREIYNPCKALFENNDKYKDDIHLLGGHFSCASHSLSLKLGVELIESSGKEYDYVIWDRLDILLFKPVILGHYNPDIFYTLKWNDAQADSFFIMSLENAKKIKGLYDSARQGNPPKGHFWIKNFIQQFLHKNISETDIIPGEHWELLRKLYRSSYLQGKITERELSKYDLSVNDIQNYE